MVLGTYWYFAFPTDLYKFDYFEFSQGYGGHADNPAELITTIETERPDKIISELKALVERYTDGLIFIYQAGNKLTIGTGGYQLFDYEFLLITEVEKILKREGVVLSNNKKLDNPSFLKFQHENNSPKNTYPTKGFLQVVGSELKKHNAENSKLRLDCNLTLNDKEDFIAALKTISIEHGIDVLFYYDKDFEDKTNLMLFFTNGRQGLNLIDKRDLDIVLFEGKLEETILKYNAGYGHISGFDLYPQGRLKIEMIIEEEFII